MFYLYKNIKAVKIDKDHKIMPMFEKNLAIAKKFIKQNNMGK